ncbi:hypothetical protein UFOVP413_17 [uncultured Caudovirales phage]|uniref:Portal protein n=1 Tax=uncultured Caudovirales phage TaxID=2100421 RepID=A0A6J5M283_9CAUD|nr:hypothetical protein UFOVP413_17 [uncultured Caudovirales phage]
MSEAKSPVQFWLDEVGKHERVFGEWRGRGRAIIDRYRDERADNSETTRFNVLWSNIQTLAPAAYGRAPVPIVERRNNDADPIGRLASTTLERALSYTISAYDFNHTMRQTTLDYLLIGRGVAWVRYLPKFGDVIVDEETNQPALDANGQPLRQVDYEQVRCDYVHWMDFAHSQARNWDEVWWVGKRVYLTRAQLIEEFGEEVGGKVTLAMRNSENQADDERDRAAVWEIWDKLRQKVFWVSAGYKDGILRSENDPLRLEGFFPCPRPAYATMSNDTLVPVPDYSEYQDQAAELDRLTQRITSIQKVLRLRGVYDSSIEGLQQLLTVNGDEKLIPIENFQALAAQGGIDKAVLFFPIEATANVLLTLYQARDKVKQDLFEISGLSDIVRGQGNAGETATAQRIKGQFATLRLQDKQQEIARFVRDVLRIKAEIISEHFAPETLSSMVNLSELEDKNMFEPAMQLLRSDKLRSFRIEIETDSTITVDEQAEKQSAIDFVSTLATLIERGLPLLQSQPAFADAMSKSIMFVARRFRTGKGLEAAFENAFAQLRNTPPAPNPEENLKKAEIVSRVINNQNQIDLKREEMLRNEGAQVFNSQLQLAQSNPGLVSP